MTQPPTPHRPLSPHLQIWRWHVTMLSSILNRITGVMSLAGLIILAGFVTCLAMGPQAYTVFLTYAANPWALIIWFGLTLAGFLHIGAGIRHLIWDLGLGFKLKDADALSLWSMILPILAAIAVFAYLYMSGKIVL